MAAAVVVATLADVVGASVVGATVQTHSVVSGTGVIEGTLAEVVGASVVGATVGQLHSVVSGTGVKVGTEADVVGAAVVVGIAGIVGQLQLAAEFPFTFDPPPELDPPELQLADPLSIEFTIA